MREFSIKKNRKHKKLNRHWQYCICGCHASMALRADYLRQLKKIHDELGIKYVRFHAIFHDDMQVMMKFSDLMPLPGAEKLNQVSFRKIGMVYDNVLACGMKPYVELSFMPKYLASTDAKCGFFYGGWISPPKDEGEWCDFIQKFVRYLLRRYGQEEVESWPFEVWNEPDVCVFWAGTKEEYFRLYEITARAIKEVDSKIRVGGPAASGSKWIGSFMQYCKTRNVPVDFISTHQYAGDPIGGVDATEDLEADGNAEAESRKPEMLVHLFDGLEIGTVLDGIRRLMPDKSEIEDIQSGIFLRNAKIVKEQAEGLPVYYSEWNENAIFSSYTNDTRKVAAYLVKTSLEVEDIINGSALWCFSDIFEEFSELPQEFHGGFGLLTHSGIPKPQYYAMKMLVDACEDRICIPEDDTENELEMAAFEDEEKIQVLLFRQKMKNLKLPKESTEVRIELEHMPRSVILERIDEEHCNPLKKWEDMGSPEELVPSEWKELLEVASMKQEEWKFQYEEGWLSFQADLGVNDVYFFTIRK